MHLRAVTGPFCRLRPTSFARASATAGTVPGNRTVVAVSADSSVCDDSTVQPAAAVARPPPCPRGLSPVLHQMMRIPINSLGFLLKVPCTLGCTGNVPVPSATSTHPPAPAYTSAPACRPGISRNPLRTALTGRRARAVVLTRHFMPGWWNWPYRPKTQGGELAGELQVPCTSGPCTSGP